MNEIFDLFNAYYVKTFQRPVIVLKARDRFGSRKTFFVENFKPYFYIPAEGFPSDGITVDGKPVKKIEVRMPGDVKTKKQLYNGSLESDIPFPQRFLIDNGIYCGFTQSGNSFVGAETLNVKPRILYIDIEVEALEGVSDSRKAKEPIYVIGCYDSYTDQLVQFVPKSVETKDQTELLYKFFNYVKERDFDLICGWNPFYDVDYLISKAEQLHVRYDNTFGYVTRGERWIDIDGRELFDLLAAYKKFFQQTKFDAYSLDFIYEKDFNEPFLEYDYNTTNFSDIELIKRVNAFHVMACQKIDVKWNLVNWADQIRRVCGCNFRQSLTTIYFTDFAWLRRAHGRVVSPERSKSEREKFDYTGGLVLEPKKGVFHNVCVLDFKKMYPSIMIAFNMSPETVSSKPIENAFEIDGVYFKKEPVGILAEMLIDFIEARNKIKRQMENVDAATEKYQMLFAHQYALKQNVDACYGVYAEPAFRMYQPLIPKSTTFMGRKFIMLAKEIVESNGYTVVAGDTDALMFEGGIEFLEVGKQMEQVVNQELQQLREQMDFKYPIEVDFELAYKSILFKQRAKVGKAKVKKKQEKIAKKRYAGTVVYEGGKEVKYLKVRGFEVRRSDSALVTRKVQSQLFELILGGASKEEITKFVKEKISGIQELPLKEFGIPRRMNMHLRDYKNPAIIRSIEFSNKYLGEQIKVGQRCYDVMVKRIKIPNGKGEVPQMMQVRKKMYKIDRVSLTNGIPEGIAIDWDAQVDRVFRNKLEPILDAIGIEWDEVFNRMRGTTLGEFGIE